MNIKKKTRNFLYKQIRKYYLKRITRNYGKVIEEKDKFVCYVNQKQISKNKKNNVLDYTMLFLHDANFIFKENKKFIGYFKLNKPVYYVFDNITFKKGLTFYSFASHVLFKNCKFYRHINIPNANEVTFENNQYFSRFLIRSGRNIFFYGSCKKLTFINDHFFNSDEGHHPTKFGMIIEADILEINNTKIDSEYPGNIEIETNKTIISNSEINAHELYLNSKNIDFLNSFINAQKGVVIENQNCNGIKNINSPVIFYNDIDLSSKKLEKIDREEIELSLQRKQIINTLRDFKKYCEQQKSEKLKEFEHDFDNQTIDKVLKKR